MLNVYLTINNKYTSREHLDNILQLDNYVFKTTITTFAQEYQTLYKSTGHRIISANIVRSFYRV